LHGDYYVQLYQYRWTDRRTLGYMAYNDALCICVVL